MARNRQSAVRKTRSPLGDGWALGPFSWVRRVVGSLCNVPSMKAGKFESKRRRRKASLDAGEQAPGYRCRKKPFSYCGTSDIRLSSWRLPERRSKNGEAKFMRIRCVVVALIMLAVSVKSHAQLGMFS